MTHLESRDVSGLAKARISLEEPDMAGARTALAWIVAAVIAGCDASAVPASPSVPTLRPSSTPTPASVPPMPSGVSFDVRRIGEEHPPTTVITQSVRWAAPRTQDVEIRVYGVTECIARPASPPPNAHGPCLVEDTPLPASVRKLLATAPAADGVASWTWVGTFDCEIGMAYDPKGPAYHAIVLAAYDTSGHSIFAIAAPGGWWQPDPNDIIC